MLAPQAIKEFVDIEAIAALAIFLSSNDAKMITGAALSIDGGWTAH
jgi:3-hydroxybutyrate dehydrogenase